MKKELLIFGAYGALGRGITAALLHKDYDKVFLFDPHIEPGVFDSPKLVNVPTGDLTVEKNVEEAFTKIEPGKDKLLFMYSTVGGYFGGKKIWETGAADWEKMFETNLKTSFFLAKNFAKFVKLSAGGAICFTSAITGITAEGNKAAYGASKSALIHLVKTLSLEGREINLSVNSIAPYIIDTPANRKWMPDEDYSKWLKPDEIGEFVNSIFSNFHFITGNTFKLTARFNIETN